MITKMKKLTFLVYHKEYEAFLAQIRELGVVHVVERQCGEMDDTLQQFMQKRTLYKNMLQSMHTLADNQPEEKVHTYRLAGNTCLAGDVIGDYSFDHRLQPGDKLVFCDMAIYSMVKNNTFNGVPLPDIALYQNGKIELVKHFGYADFEGRLS